MRCLTKINAPTSDTPAQQDQRELWAAIDAVVAGWDFVTFAEFQARVEALDAVRNKQKPKWIT